MVKISGQVKLGTPRLILAIIWIAAAIFLVALVHLGYSRGTFSTDDTVTGSVFFFVAVVFRFGGILPVSRGSIFELMHDGNIILNPENIIQDINSPMELYLGVKRKDVIRKPLAAVWPEVDRLIIAHPFDQAIIRELEAPKFAQDLINQVSMSLVSSRYGDQVYKKKKFQD